jgi:hypothetical protein
MNKSMAARPAFDLTEADEITTLEVACTMLELP